jgi:hypothetical protein
VDSPLLTGALEAPSIDLRVARDASGVLNTAFALLRENWRGLARAVFFIVGPVFLVVGAVVSLAGLTGMWVLLIALAVVHALMNTVVVGYLLLYMERGADGVELADVRALVRSDTLAAAATELLAAMASYMAGMMLFIPGLYLGVAMGVAVPARMSEDAGAGSALSRSMDLVRNHWWQTFGVQTLARALGYLLGAVACIPLFIFYGGGSRGLAAEHPVVAGILVAFNIGLAVIIYSAVVNTILTVHYFSLVEAKDGLGLLSRIEQIGEVEAPSHATTI